MTREEQKEKRRNEILEAGLDQFIRRGYAASKIRDIAEAAGMSVGLLFHYFESKEALYTELIRIGASGPTEMIQSLPELEPLAFFRLCAGQTLYYAAASLFTAKMFVLMNTACYSEGIPDKARELASTLHICEDMVPLMEAGQRDGTIRPGDPLALSITFWMALQGAVQTYALNPALPLPQAEWFVDIIRNPKDKEDMK